MNVLNKLNWNKINDHESIAHFVSSQNNQIIYVKKWAAINPTKNENIVFLFHDLCQYHGRFSSLVKWMQEKDKSLTFIAMDFVGHGLSSGTRGYFETIDVLVEDINTLLLSEIKTEHQKWFLLAHGLGGLCILDLLNRYPANFSKKVNGVILSNFIFSFKNNKILELTSGSYLLGNLSKKLRLYKVFSGAEVTTDRVEATHFEKDSLIIHRPTRAALEAVKEKSQNIYRDAYFLDWPILVQRSGDNKFEMKNAMDFFLMGIKKNLLTEKSYFNLRHDLYNEKDKENVYNDLNNWINNHENNS